MPRVWTLNPTSAPSRDRQRSELLAELLPACTPAELEAIGRCLDPGVLRRHFVEAALCARAATDATVIRLYFTDERCKEFSPNLLFSELWYRADNPDVARAFHSDGLPAFVHFIRYGITEGRWPNAALSQAAAQFDEPAPPAAALDPAVYPASNEDARAFEAAFPVLSPLELYNRYGRFLHHPLPDPGSAAAGETPAQRFAILQEEFDPAYYARTYLSDPELESYRSDPFAHYARFGIDLGNSPSAAFEEDWYRAFYRDVREAIGTGDVPCGFYHYVMRGRSEGRLPTFDLTKALEQKLPGVTAPQLISKLADFRLRLLPNDAERALRVTADAPATLWFFLPTLSPDITFGGYRAAFELLIAAKRCGYRVGIYCSEDASPNVEYFLWRERSERMREALRDVPVFGRDELGSLGIGMGDRFIIYTVWDLYRAARLAALTDCPRPYLLAQEYEPIFFDSSSTRVLAEAAYDLPHYPIINSSMLRSYFESNRIGVFGTRAAPVEFEDFSVFEHRVNQLPQQQAAAMAGRRKRLLAIYARPEMHAARNLFEIVVLALQAACEREVFGPEWSFIGLGALSEVQPIDLGRGHELRLYQRMTEQEYRGFVDALDIGVSLMCAPHPSVVPFEFATTGALVITNVYENRSAAQLRNICANIIPCEVSLADVTRAIADAVSRVNDFERRERNAYRPATKTWEQIFSDSFVNRTFAIRDAAGVPPAGRGGEEGSPRRPQGWLTRMLSSARSTP